MIDRGASALHRAVEEAFNRGDVDALVASYAEDAVLVQPDGSTARGADEIRGVWRDFVALGGRMSMTTQYCFERNGVALLSNAWQFTSDVMTTQSVSAEVAIRDADEHWRYVIDNPFGGTQAG